MSERPGWIGVALGTAAGFLAGVLVVVALGGASTHRATSTPASIPVAGGQPPTVITRVALPDLSRIRLDVAKERLRGLGFRVKVKDDGLLGVVVDENWTVIGQDPAAGQLLERGGLVTLNVSKL
jgi:beta-lactam-binding protein with PASTA domain